LIFPKPFKSELNWSSQVKLALGEMNMLRMAYLYFWVVTLTGKGKWMQIIWNMASPEGNKIYLLLLVLEDVLDHYIFPPVVVSLVNSFSALSAPYFYEVQDIHSEIPLLVLILGLAPRVKSELEITQRTAGCVCAFQQLAFREQT
jgi:hypothetical protein